MAVGTEVVAVRYEDVVADTPISVPMPLYEATDISVVYGMAALIAVYNTDYTITLGEDFDTFTLTPTASLIAKIDALIVIDPTEENYITVRRRLDYLTDTTAAAVRYTPFTSREFERTALRFQQIQEQLNRALVLSPGFVGDQPLLALTEVLPGRALILSDDGTSIVAGPNAEDLAAAQANAAIAVAAAGEATAAAGVATQRLADVNDAADTALTNITNTTNAALSSVEGAKDDAIDEINAVVQASAMQHVTSIAAQKAINTVAVKHCMRTLYGVTRPFEFLAGDYSAEIAADEWGAAYVKADAVAANVGAWVATDNWRVCGLRMSDFGFVSDELNPIVASTTNTGVSPKTITEGPLQRAFDMCVDMSVPFVVDNVYWINDYLMMKSGARVLFLRGIGRLVAAVSEPVMGGFIIGRYGPTVSDYAPISDIEFYDADIDCNSKAAMNGIALAFPSRLRFHGRTRVANTLHSTTNLGGRATQFEGGACEDIHIDELYIENCSIGINSQALPLPADYTAKHISYGRVVMENVGMPFNIDCTTTGSENLKIDRMSTFIGSALLHNCGRPAWLASADRYKGGIITGDRGSGLYIDSLRVVNDDSYGLVGALFKGTMYGVVVNKAEMYGQIQAIADFNYLDYITSASNAAHPSWVEADVVWRGSAVSALPRVLDTGAGGGRMGNLRLKVAAHKAFVTAICTANAGGYDNAKLTLVDLSSGKEYPTRSALQWYSWGNSYDLAAPPQKLYRSRRDMASGTARAFFTIPVPAHGRASLVVQASAHGVSSSTLSACTTEIVPIAISRDGGGALTAVVGTAATAKALDGYTAVDLAYSVADSGGTHAVVSITASNSAGAELMVMASAELTTSTAGAAVVVTTPDVQ